MRYQFKASATKELINRLAVHNDAIPSIPVKVVSVDRCVAFNDYVVVVLISSNDTYGVPMFFSPRSFSRLFEEVK